MDSKNRQELSNYRIQQAKETLELAKYCLEHGYYRDAINRSYYAAFYAVKAVLALDFVDFKKHKDAVGHFNKTYVASDIFPRDTGRKLAKMQQVREKSDYDDFFLAEREKAEEQIQSAEYIFEEVNNYLDREKKKSIDNLIQDAGEIVKERQETQLDKPVDKKKDGYTI